MSAIIEKITALRAKIPENGATEDEAIAALAAADKLMAKHGITEADLNTVKFDKDMRDGIRTQKQKQQHPVSKYCGVALMNFCGVTGWYQGGSRETHFFGFDQDVAMAEFLFDMIMQSMDRGWKEFLATHPKEPGVSRHSQYWSFMIGFARRIIEKLDELREHRETSYTGGTELAVKKSELVAQGLEALYPELALRQAKRRGTKVYKDAVEAGKAAGDKVNLGRPVEQQERKSTKRIT